MNAAEINKQLCQQLDKIILGKSQQIKLAFICFLAEGHLLIEDIPGVGKTTLAKALAKVLGLTLKRIQFTNDLLPADIVGVSIFNREQHQFEFHQGPIFTELLLADELNRATPKTQSALLEALAEKKVSVDGNTYDLPENFFVIATQNPTDLYGTFPLPDSQLDRFLMCISLGYPDEIAEKTLLHGGPKKITNEIDQLKPIIQTEQINELKQQVHAVRATPAIIDYIHRLVIETRNHPEITTGLSPRAALAILTCSKVNALLEGRDYCLPDDVQAIFNTVAGHRLQTSSGQNGNQNITNAIINQIAVETPEAAAISIA